MPRQFVHLPPGYCDACGKGCDAPFQVFHRCYWCFAGAFVPAELFSIAEYDGQPYAIPRQEIAEPPPEALAVNVADPPAAELRARADAFDHRFERLAAPGA